MKAIHLQLLWYTSLLTVPSAVARTCYYPDGGLAQSDTVCNATATNIHTSCCGAFDDCMESGLCLSSGLISRGSCTDPTFKDPACAPYCQDSNPSGGALIVPRYWGDNSKEVSDIEWCCGLPLANGSCADGTATKVVVGDPKSRFGKPVSNSTSNSTSVSDTKCKANHDVAIGVGLGVPFLIAVISLLALWLWERRKRQTAEVLERPPEKTTGQFYDPADNSGTANSPNSMFMPASIKPRTDGYQGTYQPGTYQPVARPRPSEVDGTPKLNELPEH